MFRTITTEVDVDICLDEFPVDEIIDYLEDSGYNVYGRGTDDGDALAALADAKVYHPEKFDKMFADYIFEKLGRII